MTNVHDEAVATEFSTNLRRATWTDHENAEFGRFMQALLKAELNLQQYGALTAQLYFVYEAIEAAAEKQENDPVAGKFIFHELDRKAAIEKDMAFYYGDDWRSTVKPLPTTQAYVARINEVAPTWGGGFLAHHYTRYMGDLSGGIQMRKVGESTYGLSDQGLNFYQFPQIQDATKFKINYRDQLDALDLDDAEKDRIIAEVAKAYQLNIEMLSELGRTELAAA